MRSRLVSLGLVAVSAASLVAAVTSCAPGPTPTSRTPDSFSGVEPDSTWLLVEASTPGVDGFSVLLPPGWEFNRLQGFDSFVGEFVGDEIELHFDYGRYSNSLARMGSGDDPAYVIVYEEVEGFEVKLVQPVPGGEGYTGIYVDRTGSGPNSLSIISTGTLSEAQRSMVLGIYRSVHPL